MKNNYLTDCLSTVLSSISLPAFILTLTRTLTSILAFSLSLSLILSLAFALVLIPAASDNMFINGSGSCAAFASGIEFKTAVHTDKLVKISYPQISGMSDAAKMSKINALIKEHALAIKSPFSDDLKEVEIEGNYTIEYNGSNILSVKYSVYANVKNAAHPVDVISAANIDLNALKLLKLSDVATVDENLVELFLKGKYIPRGEDLDLESAGALKDIIAGFDKKELLVRFKDPAAAFYFTQDSLVISAEVIHAAGDHAEFAVSYKDLGKSLLFKPEGFVKSDSIK